LQSKLLYVTTPFLHVGHTTCESGEDVLGRCLGIFSFLSFFTLVQWFFCWSEFLGAVAKKGLYKTGCS